MANDWKNVVLKFVCGRDADVAMVQVLETHGAKGVALSFVTVQIIS